MDGGRGNANFPVLTATKPASELSPGLICNYLLGKKNFCMLKNAELEQDAPNVRVWMDARTGMPDKCLAAEEAGS